MPKPAHFAAHGVVGRADFERSGFSVHSHLLKSLLFSDLRRCSDGPLSDFDAQIRRRAHRASTTGRQRFWKPLPPPARCGWSRQASAARGPRRDLRQVRQQTLTRAVEVRGRRGDERWCRQSRHPAPSRPPDRGAGADARPRPARRRRLGRLTRSRTVCQDPRPCVRVEVCLRGDAHRTVIRAPTCPSCRTMLICAVRTGKEGSGGRA